jgi:mono/diheme cytochrome c family protein
MRFIKRPTRNYVGRSELPTFGCGGWSLGAIAVGVTTTLHAQQAGSASQGVDVGKYLYESHCAICHGSSGTDSDRGPYWSKPVPSLATLSNRNGGVFPFMRVYETIDGRNEVQTHGPRDMPVWGKEFTAQSLDLNPYYNPEGFARAKILALTEYVYRLQAK